MNRDEEHHVDSYTGTESGSGLTAREVLARALMLTTRRKIVGVTADTCAGYEGDADEILMELARFGYAVLRAVPVPPGER